jgi:hypothetical protein
MADTGPAGLARIGFCLALREAHRAGILREQVQNWQLTSQMDAYLAAVADRIALLDGDELAAASEWIALGPRVPNAG